MYQRDITIAIAARNSAKTVARAIASVLKQGDFQILLVDDHSKDDTIDVAREAGQGHVSVVRPVDHRGFGNARQTGIENVDTTYMIWMDAADELLPGRIERMEVVLKKGADIVFDAVELFDGETKKSIQIQEMPPFMRSENSMLRLFERSYLPGPAWPGLRTKVARAVGYDIDMAIGEEYDFNLRATRMGARFHCLKEVGYRHYHSGERVSKELKLRRELVGRALTKHDYQETFEFLESRGMDDRLAYWALCSMAVYRKDYNQAEEFLHRAVPKDADLREMLDPEGPSPVCQGWKKGFMLGTLELLKGRFDDKGWLARAEELQPRADSANNNGIAMARQNNLVDARKCFEAALQRLPGYNDAQINIKTLSNPSRITSHPLRWSHFRNI